jgi:radical SAM superfamily enzyme YgiQ (UPF0313 family)
MDVIFINGGFFKQVYRTIGPYQLAHWIRQNGYECQVIDFINHMTNDELLKYVEKFITENTICIGVSSTFWNSNNKKSSNKTNAPDILRSVLTAVRERYPKIKLVLGGHTADFVTNETYALFDASIIGDAEDSFLELLESYKKQKKIFHSVTRGGRPFINAKPNQQFNIQHLAHRFTDNDCIVPGEAMPIEISRGCIFRCAFCQYPHLGKTKYDYLRDFDLIAEEMQYNYNKFKTSNYYILDDTFNDSDFKIQSWYNLLTKLDFSINYVGYLRADLLHRNPAHIDLLKNSGLMSCHIGIESFHPTASRLVGKGWSGKEARTFLPKLKSKWQNDVTIHSSLIVGLPPETVDDLKNTQQWFLDNGLDSWSFKPLMISAGNRYMSSEFDKNYESYGFTVNENGNWKTEYMDVKQAVKIATILNTNSSLRQKVTVWEALNLISEHVSKELINTTYRQNLPGKLVKQSQLEFVNHYKRLLDIV